MNALDLLTKSSEETFVCAQVLIEHWAVATRPISSNGLGLDIEEVDRNLCEMEGLLNRLAEPPDIATEWRLLVRRHRVVGKQVHDARLVAFMVSHGITHILTLNPSDFVRYPEITAITPAEVAIV